MQRETQERLVGATILIIAGVVLIPWLLDGSMTEPGTSEQELVLPGGSGNGNETRTISLEVPRTDRATSSRAAEIDSRSVRSEANSAMNLPAPGQSSNNAASQPSATVASAKTAVDESSKPGTIKVPERFAKPMPSGTADSKTASTSRPTQATPEVKKPPPVQPAKDQSPSVESVSAKVEPEKPAPTHRTDIVPKPTPAPVRAASTKPVTKEGWAVQVGSFASEDNAERLAKKLRDKSYKAFVMRNVIDGRVLFRVRVGPVKQRNEADLLAAALTEDRQPARVLSHP